MFGLFLVIMSFMARYYTYFKNPHSEGLDLSSVWDKQKSACESLSEWVCQWWESAGVCERERDSVCVCVCEWINVSMRKCCEFVCACLCVCVYKRERTRDWVKVCERER